MQLTDPIQNTWLKFLNPDTLRENLIRASMFLTAFELLEDSVVDDFAGLCATSTTNPINSSTAITTGMTFWLGTKAVLRLSGLADRKWLLEPRAIRIGLSEFGNIGI